LPAAGCMPVAVASKQARNRSRIAWGLLHIEPMSP
jgi:hypothetical protein